MTLILKATVNSGENGAFVIASADTRMVYKPFNAKTHEMRDETLGMRNDIYDKVIPLNERVLFIGGGISSVYESFKDYLIERAKEHYFVDDFEQIFYEAYNYFKENGNGIMKKYIDSQYVHLTILGIRKDGTPEEIRLDGNGGISKQDTRPGMTSSGMFSPSADINKKTKELMDFENSPHWNENDIFQTYVDHLLLVHTVIASQEVETVSDESLIHIVHRDWNGEIKYYNGSFDLSEQIKQIQQQYQEAT